MGGAVPQKRPVKVGMPAITLIARASAMIGAEADADTRGRGARAVPGAHLAVGGGVQRDAGPPRQDAGGVDARRRRLARALRERAARSQHQEQSPCDDLFHDCICFADRIALVLVS